MFNDAIRSLEALNSSLEGQVLNLEARCADAERAHTRKLSEVKEAQVSVT